MNPEQFPTPSQEPVTPSYREQAGAYGGPGGPNRTPGEIQSEQDRLLADAIASKNSGVEPEGVVDTQEQADEIARKVVESANNKSEREMGQDLSKLLKKLRSDQPEAPTSPTEDPDHTPSA